jgi:hypothetical protein
VEGTKGCITVAPHRGMVVTSTRGQEALVGVIGELRQQIAVLEDQRGRVLSSIRTPRSSVPGQDWG